MSVAVSVPAIGYSIWQIDGEGDDGVFALTRGARRSYYVLIQIDSRSTNGNIPASSGTALLVLYYNSNLLLTNTKCNCHTNAELQLSWSVNVMPSTPGKDVLSATGVGVDEDGRLSHLLIQDTNASDVVSVTPALQCVWRVLCIVPWLQ